MERHGKARRHDLYCAALTASAIYNVHREKGSPPIAPEALIGEESSKPEQRQTPAETRLTVQMLAEAFGGTVTTT